MVVIARAALLVLLALLVLVFFSACASGSHERAEAETASSRRISGFGVSLELPTGWHGRVVKPGERDAIVIQAGNFQRPDEAYLGPKTANAMNEDSIHIELAGFDPESYELVGTGNWRAAELPISIDRSHLGGPFSGMPAPAVAARWLVIDGRAVMLRLSPRRWIASATRARAYCSFPASSTSFETIRHLPFFTGTCRLMTK